MVPNASEITRRRVTAATVIRLFAFAVASVALVPLMVLGIAISEGGIGPHPQDWAPFLIAMLVFLGGGLTIWCLAPWAARLMIRVPRLAACPNCHYKLESLATPQCTECGYTLTPEFLTTRAERAAGTPEPDTVLLRQISTLVIRIGSGILLPGALIGGFVAAAETINNPYRDGWPFVIAWVAASFFAAGCLLLASWISVLCVPGRSRFERRSTTEPTPQGGPDA